MNSPPGATGGGSLLCLLGFFDLVDPFQDLSEDREHFIGVAGLSIKQVAPEFGFHWRDDDPGGLQAQAWIDSARGGDSATREALRIRLLDYNEDDVRATAAVRNGLRTCEASAAK